MRAHGFQIWKKSGKFDSTDEIDFKGDWVDRVCHEFISSEIRAMNQAGNLHLIEKDMGGEKVYVLFWDILPVAI